LGSLGPGIRPSLFFEPPLLFFRDPSPKRLPLGQLVLGICPLLSSQKRLVQDQTEIVSKHCRKFSTSATRFCWRARHKDCLNYLFTKPEKLLQLCWNQQKESQQTPPFLPSPLTLPRTAAPCPAVGLGQQHNVRDAALYTLMGAARGAPPPSQPPPGPSHAASMRSPPQPPSSPEGWDGADDRSPFPPSVMSTLTQTPQISLQEHN